MSVAIGGSPGAPVNITGLASGLNTGEIISALLAVEREPITRMSNQERPSKDSANSCSPFRAASTSSRLQPKNSAPRRSSTTFRASARATPTKVTATTSAGAAIGATSC